MFNGFLLLVFWTLAISFAGCGTRCRDVPRQVMSPSAVSCRTHYSIVSSVHHSSLPFGVHNLSRFSPIRSVSRPNQALHPCFTKITAKQFDLLFVKLIVLLLKSPVSFHTLILESQLCFVHEFLNSHLFFFSVL